MSATIIASKKRKREDAEPPHLQLSSKPASHLGPVLASLPALRPSKNTSFRCYVSKKPRLGQSGVDQADSEEEEEDFSQQNTFVAGETDTVEFFSSSETKYAGVGCRYFVAVHNRRTQTTIFRPAPLYILCRQVKALKSIGAAPVTTQERVAARAALGESFGTKKAQAAIRAAERNKVDVAVMENVIGHLVDRIGKNTAALPTQEQMKSQADTNRLIPCYIADAADPSDVYAIKDIIPELELKAISVTALLGAQSDSQRIALLPFKRSGWVKHHLKSIFGQEPPSKSQIKLLYYISVMFAFRQATFNMREGNIDHVMARMYGVPEIIIEGLMARFTEIPRGSTLHQTTSETETSLLTHMFALCLRVDNYASDSSVIAVDLGMPATKVNQLFRSLGCKIEKLQARDLKRLGLPGQPGQIKRAVLKVPLEFPKMRTALKKRS